MIKDFLKLSKVFLVLNFVDDVRLKKNNTLVTEMQVMKKIFTQAGAKRVFLSI